MTQTPLRVRHAPTPRALCFTLTVVALCFVPRLAPAEPAPAPASPFTLVTGVRGTFTPRRLASAQATETRGQVSPDGKTLTFLERSIRLVAVTGPEDDMLSYRIAGKRNPALIVPRGATIRMLFVNTDDDMKHDIRFRTALKTYPSVMAPAQEPSVGTPEMAPKSGAALHGEELTLHAPASPGAYIYVCTVRGHAQGGMVGKIIVR